MPEHFLDVTIEVRAPFLTQTTTAGRPGIDAAAARRDGRVLLPGSLVKGKLREAWLKLAALAADAAPLSKDDIDEWLGQESDGGNEPRRGRLGFLDFVAQGEEDRGTRYRVAMDHERGGVEAGALAVVEVPFAPGRVVPLHGGIHFVAEQDKAVAICDAVRTGLRFTDSVGAYASLGFGQVVGVSVEARWASRPRVATATPAVEETGGFDLEIEVDGPLLVARFQPQGNLFVSDTVLPGGALKGALAATWRESVGRRPSGPVDGGLDEERRELGEAFAALRFRHGFLGRDGRRPVAIPLSLVSVQAEGERQLVDVALRPGPSLIDGQAPAFAVDWKRRTWEQAEELCGWVGPRYETRVRTGMDPDLRKGAEGQLFAYRTVVPQEGQVFYARVDLEGVDPDVRGPVAAQLGSLLEGGLRHLGKTQTSARVRICPPGQVVPAVPGRGGGNGAYPTVLTLQTPAVLLDPLALHEGSGRQALAREYGRVWEELAGGALELKRFFARQRLAGGGYLWARFQKPRPYHPYLLTEPGSVFVFEGTAAAEAVVEAWGRHGLDLPAWAVERYRGSGADGSRPAAADGVVRGGDDWRRCPFVRQNGYGEVAVDLALHWERDAADRARQIRQIRAEEAARGGGP